MTEPPWAAPDPQRHHIGLVVALVVCLLTVVGGAGLSGYLLYHASRRDGPAWGASWHTASFTVDGDDSTRVDAGKLLTLLAGRGARYEVHGGRIVVAVPPGRSAALSRLRALAPIRTDLSVRPVLDVSTPSPGCTPGGRPACDRSGARYRLGPSVLSGRQVTDVHTGSDRSAGWSVTVRFSSAGQQAISDATSRYAGQRLAIVVAGAVLSAPRVSAPVSGALRVSGGTGGGQPHRVAAAFRLGQHPVTIRAA
ncbi:hypothetical protein Athai_61780 [Actinocatenispora thailandica]|uniref:SecDF P1 head subdomain domain-containing protein n=1 Tax=Actinocatenispora thailandica TaxID=227318 RepID=A0A7R7DW26_9ACTN|nr:hypothetical protein [Actinocatenispora thailandica]BCJ38675.1 hypothetical protein Athai_61780 [Actinocatenispora thailandica]